MPYLMESDLKKNGLLKGLGETVTVMRYKNTVTGEVLEGTSEDLDKAIQAAEKKDPVKNSSLNWEYVAGSEKTEERQSFWDKASGWINPLVDAIKQPAPAVMPDVMPPTTRPVDDTGKKTNMVILGVIGAAVIGGMLWAFSRR